ncbi:hypothetical protein [Acetobacter conturbans]|uniref:Uncharacterized protein n=1 Tax=Acetobacter conturbans TaxID=1737472 RepID=A0ABX0K016_9PROT|nr:hypothetical protein [Acetobacter conturbans]NHN88459.1 hypothetical protein [Acetobacter conturbans]
MEQGTFARRGLLAVVIGMGLLIVLGTGGLVAILIHRMSHPRQATIVPVASTILSEKPFLLHEPAGTRIESIAWQNGPVMAVRLSGGGPDRIVLWDTAAARTVGELDLVQ